MGCFMNDDQNWTTLASELDARGWAVLPDLLDATAARGLPPAMTTRGSSAARW